MVLKVQLMSTETTFMRIGGCQINPKLGIVSIKITRSNNAITSKVLHHMWGDVADSQ